MRRNVASRPESALAAISARKAWVSSRMWRAISSSSRSSLLAKFE